MKNLRNKKVVLEGAGVDKRVEIKSIQIRSQSQDLAKVVEIKRCEGK
jgi:hypothetical protein